MEKRRERIERGEEREEGEGGRERDFLPCFLGYTSITSVFYFVSQSISFIFNLSVSLLVNLLFNY